MSADPFIPAPLTPIYDPDLVAWKFIRDLVKAAQDHGQEAGVTRHLVGAMLHLVFPDAVQDNPTGQVAGQTVSLGDYLVGDTVFHVIMTPVLPVYDHCRENIEQGFQVFLLVTDKYFCGTRQNAEILLPGKIMVASIESFICQALERLAGFYRNEMKRMLRQLLETYNERVKNLAAGQAPRIQLPRNLTA
jgi:hypothetical protein